LQRARRMALLVSERDPSTPSVSQKNAIGHIHCTRCIVRDTPSTRSCASAPDAEGDSSFAASSPSLPPSRNSSPPSAARAHHPPLRDRLTDPRAARYVAPSPTRVSWAQPAPSVPARRERCRRSPPPNAHGERVFSADPATTACLSWSAFRLGERRRGAPSFATRRPRPPSLRRSRTPLRARRATRHALAAPARSSNAAAWAPSLPTPLRATTASPRAAPSRSRQPRRCRPGNYVIDGWLTPHRQWSRVVST